MAENNKFEQSCQYMIEQIKKQININKNDSFAKKIGEVIDEKGIIKKYIESISDYAQKIKEGEYYKDDVLKFIDSSHIDYKKTKNDAKKVMKDFEKILKDEGVKTDAIDKLIDMFEYNIKEYKQILQKVKKKMIEKSGLARIETLEHNLLYCKGNDVEKSNKIGFLNYLHYMISQGKDVEIKEKEMIAKLRFPFNENISNSNFCSKIKSNVNNLCSGLNEHTSKLNIYQSDSSQNGKFYKIAEEVEKTMYLVLEKQQNLQLTQGQIRKILKKSFENELAASAYNELRDDIFNIIKAQAVAKIMNENISKCINGNADKLIQDGAYGVLINSISLFCCIFTPVIRIVYDIGKSVYNLAQSLGKFAKGSYKKVKDINKIKN